MITTSEAAERLEVSRSRVLELIKNGQLDAEKHSGVWFVDESSVEMRVRSVRKKGGRPPRGSGNDEVSFTFMNRTHELSDVVYNRKLREFTFIDGIIDEQRAPVGLANASGSISPIDFNTWWRNRGIPGARIGVQELLRQAGVNVPEELLMRNLGLSLSDQYWIRPKQSGLHWEDVNFFNNDFDEVDERTDGFVESVKTAHAHPDNTSDGNLEKCWLVRNGVRMLRKGSRYNGQEPYNEVVATILHGKLLSEGEYVPYVLDGVGSSAWSLCPDFLTDEEEYVPAMYVMRLRDQLGHENDFDHYVSCCEQLGARQARESLYRLIVCDDIIANSDRHFRNFGIVRNVETLECRPAPLFDSGSSLWCDVDFAELSKGKFSFTSKQFESNPARQLLLVEDFSWFDAGRLDGFVDEALETLAANDMLEKRLPYIRAALQRRIERIVDIAEWS